jgi:hypothetical protein
MAFAATLIATDNRIRNSNLRRRPLLNPCRKAYICAPERKVIQTEVSRG